MIIGAHIMLESTNDAADKAFFADVLKLPAVDAGGGFLIFGVPPAEVAVHGSERNDVHQLYLMCDDIGGFIEERQPQGIACTTPRQQGWGALTEITLPGGGRLGVYQPRHARPKQTAAKRVRKAKAKPRTTAKRRAPAKKRKAKTRR